MSVLLLKINDFGFIEVPQKTPYAQSTNQMSSAVNPVLVRSVTHNRGMQAVTTESRIVDMPSNCMAGHFSLVFADWTESHIHSVINGVMIRLTIRNGVTGWSSSQESKVSNGADTTSQIMTLTTARKRHERTGLVEGVLWGGVLVVVALVFTDLDSLLVNGIARGVI